MRKKVKVIVAHALIKEGFSESEADKILSVLVSVEAAHFKALDDSPNIFNDYWGARGPDCRIVQG